MSRFSSLFLRRLRRIEDRCHPGRRRNRNAERSYQRRRSAYHWGVRRPARLVRARLFPCVWCMQPDHIGRDCPYPEELGLALVECNTQEQRDRVLLIGQASVLGLGPDRNVVIGSEVLSRALYHALGDVLTYGIRSLDEARWRRLLALAEATLVVDPALIYLGWSEGRDWAEEESALLGMWWNASGRLAGVDFDTPDFWLVAAGLGGAAEAI